MSLRPHVTQPVSTERGVRWQDLGACAGMPTEMFYSPDGERGAHRTAREVRAKAICSTCQVLVRCRREALDTGEPYGTWGGLSETEREAIRQRPATEADAWVAEWMAS